MNTFDLMAKDYDTDIRITRAKAIADEIRAHIINGHKKSAIEYGCGTGLVGFQLLNDFSRLLFVDSSPEMIAQVQQKIEKQEKLDAATLCSDFSEDVPQELHADYILLSLVLHHIKDTENILRQLFGLLNTDGHLLIVDIDEEDGKFHSNHPDFYGHNGFGQSFLIDLAKRVGFSQADARTFYNGSKPSDGKNIAYSLFILDAVK